MVRKDIKVDSILLLLIGTLTLFIIGVIKGFNEFWTSPVEVQLHDTYFVFGTRQVFVYIFLSTAFWTYLIRQAKNKFKRQTSNVVLLLVTGLLILITTLTYKMIGMMDQEWTVYPPLSALPESEIPKTSVMSIVKVWILWYEIFQITTLGLVGIMIGRGVEKHYSQQ